MMTGEMKEVILKMIRKRGFDIVRLRNAFHEQKQIVGKENPTIFDVGANEGQTAQKYLKLFKQPRIYSFEPTRETFERLDSNFKNRVHAINKALGSKIGNKMLFMRNKSVYNSFLMPMDVDDAEEIGEDMAVIDTVDNFCSKNNIKQIDVLKIDVEGYELEVLKGAARMLSKGRIKVIYSECYLNPSYEGAITFFDIYRFIQRYGFVLYNIYNLVYNTKTKQIRFCDAIFVKRK